MVTQEAVALLQKKLGRCDDGETSTELAAALDCMPLAIAQAAAYISRREHRCSVAQYLHKLRQSDHEMATLLGSEGDAFRRDWEATNSILLTWHISFDYIRQQRRSATDLLSLMSFFDRQGIPEALLQHHADAREYGQHKPKWRCRALWHLKHLLRRKSEHYRDRTSAESTGTEEEESSTDCFEEDLVVLRNFSFISITEDRSVFEMHRLVQLATRKWLRSQGRLERWKGRSVQNLCKEFPTGEYENWVQCQVLLPHVKLAVVQQPEEKEALKDWATVMYRGAWYLWRMGDGREAEDLATKAMKVRKGLLGAKHEDTVWSKAMVASTYRDQGRWDG